MTREQYMAALRAELVALGYPTYFESFLALADHYAEGERHEGYLEGWARIEEGTLPE